MPWSVRKRWTVAVTVLLAIPVVVVLGGVALFIGWIFFWFHEDFFFSGDGVMRHAVGDATFQVEFPAVDLSKAGHYEFHFTRLAPPMGYAVGFRVPDRSSALVSMTMSNERGETVFQQKRRLSDWSWNRDMAVIDGVIEEVPIGGGSVRIEQRGRGPDGGWGTFFEPRWSGRYTLTIEVIEPDSKRLLARPVIEGYTAGL